MITLFPIAFWHEPGGNSGTYGTNWPFVCWASRDYQFPAAGMAQEIYESRYKTVRFVPLVAGVMAIAAGVSFALGRTPHPSEVALAFFASIIIASMFMAFYKPWERELELRGRAVEVDVRAVFYGDSRIAALEANARSLTGYSQFHGWKQERLEGELLRREKLARNWVASNLKMIDRAYKEGKQ